MTVPEIWRGQNRGGEKRKKKEKEKKKNEREENHIASPTGIAINVVKKMLLVAIKKFSLTEFMTGIRKKKFLTSYPEGKLLSHISRKGKNK